MYCVFYVVVCKRIDEFDQKRDDQLQKIHVPEKQPWQVLQSVFQGNRNKRAGVLRMYEKPIKLRRRQILL